MNPAEAFRLQIAEIGNQAPTTAAYKRVPKPHSCWPLQDWLLHLENNLPVNVNRGIGSTPNQEIASSPKSLSQTEIHALVGGFFDRPAGHLQHALLKSSEGSSKLGNDLSKVPPSIRLLLFQMALSGQGGNLCTLNLNFAESFLKKAAARSSSEDSFTSILNDRIKLGLRTAFDERFGRGNYISPPYWWILEHAPPDIKGDRRGIKKGIRALHIHGEIVASNELLPVVKAGLEKASAGYSVKGNNAVKFGEPISYLRKRRWPSEKCLSQFPDVVRADRKDYQTYWPDTYCQKDFDRTQMTAKRLGIETGSLWKVSSPLVTNEAQACLKLLNLLIKYA